MQDFRESVRWEKNRKRHWEKINAYVILLGLSSKLVQERDGHWKWEVRPPNFIDRYPECILEYIWDLAPRDIVGDILEDAYKVSFADFWSSVDLRHL